MTLSAQRQPQKPAGNTSKTAIPEGPRRRSRKKRRKWRKRGKRREGGGREGGGKERREVEEEEGEEGGGGGEIRTNRPQRNGKRKAHPGRDNLISSLIFEFT